MKLQKHKIIAQTWAQRNKFNEGGRISILFQHTDPVGLHFDLNSGASNDLSTAWAANLPRLINRRGAVPNDVIDSYSSNNQSIDSEVSLNVRHVSIESRRNSGDSQLSVQIAELKATRKVNKRRHPNRPNRRNFRRNKRRNLSKSSTSLDSHFQLMNALTNTTDARRILEQNLQRRNANAGLDAKYEKLVINSRNNNAAGGCLSEDENVSVTISESKFNLILSNPNTMDLNDMLTIKSLHDGVQIEEISSSDSDNTTKKDYGQEKHYLLGNCSGGRDSKRSRKSKNSNYREIVADSDDSFNDCDLDDEDDDNEETEKRNSSGQEIRTSRQSKTSTDVAVQTNCKF